MRQKIIVICIGFLCMSSSQGIFGQVVLKIIPLQLENVIANKDCEFQIINKQDNDVDIFLHLQIDHDTNSCILKQQSYELKLKRKQNFRVNWDTICNCDREELLDKKILEKGIYNISLIAIEKESLKMLGSDCLQIFYSE